MLTLAFVLLNEASPAQAIQPTYETPTAQPEAVPEKTDTFFYTLQIEQGNDLAALEKTADYITQIIPLRVRIVKEDEGYVIRSGKLLQGIELEDYVTTLKSVGFSDATIIYIPADNEKVIKVLNPGASESAGRLQNQPYLLRTQQEESPSVSRHMSEIFPAETIISRMSRLEKEVSQDTKIEKDLLIQRAWEAYRHGSATACDLFDRAQTYPKADQEASRGFAYCFLQMGKYEEAINLLTELLHDGVKQEETRTLLVEALFKAGRYDSALDEAHFLEESQAQQWSAIISANKRAADLAHSHKRYDLENPKTFAEELGQCLLSNAFLTAMQGLLTAKNEESTALFKRLLNVCDGKWGIKIPTYIRLIQALPLERLPSLIDQKLVHKGLPPDYREKLLPSKFDRLLRHIASDWRRESAEEADALTQQDMTAQIFLAWRRFNQGDYAAAHEYFLALYLRDPQEKSIIEGLTYTLARLGKMDEAIDLAETTRDATLQTVFLREKLINSLPGSNEALELSRRILALDPKDKTALDALITKQDSISPLKQ